MGDDNNKVKTADHQNSENFSFSKMTATKEATEPKEAKEPQDKMEIEEEEEEMMSDIKKMSTDEITARARLLDNEIRIMRADIMRIQHEMQTQKDKIKENTEKIKVNKTLPYLVS